MPQTDDPRTAQAGDTLPPFVRKSGFHHWNRFAAVNYEFVPIHMDDDAGRAAGYPSAFGMGNLQWAYLHNMLRGWLGDAGRITRLRVQFRAANVKGQRVAARGEVTSVRDAPEGRVIELKVWTEADDGQTLAPGEASVLVDPH